jgi:hypothetical protein
MGKAVNNRGLWRSAGCLAAAAGLIVAASGGFPARPARGDGPASSKADPALERTREQVKMLDDLYKTVVVSISKTYVTQQEAQPAIMIAKQVFTAMRKNKWHSARLVDATGEPINDENSPTTDFEKQAYEKIRAGQPYFEMVVGEGQNRRLLAATVVPAVIQNCTTCHDNKKVGDVLGFIRYDIPVK